MAEGSEDGSRDPLASNPILQGIDPTLNHILIQVDVKPKEDIVQDIVDSIDVEDIEQNRNKLLDIAVRKFEDTLKRVRNAHW